MIQYYNVIEQQQIKRSAMLIQRTFAYIDTILKPGMLQTELVIKTRKFVESRGGQFCVQDEFPQPFCVCVNDVIAHGIAEERPFRQGDLVTIDIALSVNGWVADAAWTFGIPVLNKSNLDILNNSWQITVNAIQAVQIGKPLNLIGASIESDIHFYGMQVYKEFSGHGIGKKLHESPRIYHYYDDRTLPGDLVQPGMVFTIEPVVTFGHATIIRDSNLHSYRSEDSRPSAQFEHTVAITEDDVIVLSFFGMSASKLPHLLQYIDPFAISEDTA